VPYYLMGAVMATQIIVRRHLAQAGVSPAKHGRRTAALAVESPQTARSAPEV
jgi:hypothetical protein